jgi:hypothetical protein
MALLARGMDFHFSREGAMSPFIRAAVAGCLAAGVALCAGTSAWATCKLYICAVGKDVPQSQTNQAYEYVVLSNTEFSSGKWHYNAIVPGRSQFQVEGQILEIPEYPGQLLSYSVEACSEPSGAFQRSVCTGWSTFSHRAPGG